MFKIEKRSKFPKRVVVVHGTPGDEQFVGILDNYRFFKLFDLSGKASWEVKGYKTGAPWGIKILPNCALTEFSGFGNYVAFSRETGEPSQFFKDEQEVNLLGLSASTGLFCDRGIKKGKFFYRVDFESGDVAAYESEPGSEMITIGDGSWCFGNMGRKDGENSHLLVVAKLFEKAGQIELEELIEVRVGGDFHSASFVSSLEFGLVFQLTQKEGPDSELITIGKSGQILGRFDNPKPENTILIEDSSVCLIEGQVRLVAIFQDKKRWREDIVCLDPISGEETWRASIPMAHHVFIGHYLIAVVGTPFEPSMVVPVDPTMKGSSWVVDLRNGKVERLQEKPVAPWISLAGDGFIFATREAKSDYLMYATLKEE